MAAKKLKREHYSLSGINNSKRIKKINSKRKKKTAPYKLQIVNIDVWKHLLQTSMSGNIFLSGKISCMSDGFGSIIF